MSPSSFFSFRYLSVITLLFCSLLAFSQEASRSYSRVQIDLSNKTIQEVAALGLEADHGVYAKGKHFINDFSQAEIDLLQSNGFDFDILIEDVVSYYIERNKAQSSHDHGDDQRVVVDCTTESGGIIYDYQTPENYEYGSMGGYLTYAEMLVELDEMVAMYPNLISAREAVPDILTYEGRPIEWLRISDNPNMDEEEPEILYTALHHAREPNSLSQTIFYMWYVLENYASDPEVQYLIDNTQMFFIPCVNPDGYVYNETIEPNGGGLWRKNRFDNGDGSIGVDLNRNYGYEWGFDDSGSSPNTSSQVYRGTEGFSEAETQALRDFCNERELQITLNYHTYGNLLIYPFGFSDTPTPDAPTFSAFADAMTRENDFTAGTGTQTVGYVVNGSSDDWMYGEMDSKPAIFSLTPEVGDGGIGFWPAQSQIDENNRSVMLQNLTAAHLLLNYGEAIEIDPLLAITEQTGTIELEGKKYGLLSGDLTLELTAILPLAVLSNNSMTWSMEHLDVETMTVDYTISDDAVNGDEIQFLLSIGNGEYAWTDTISKTYLAGETVTIFSDPADDMSNWNVSGTWDLTDEDFVSGPSSITDSPNSEYSDDVYAEIISAQMIDLSNSSQASLQFYARWDIESNYDYVQVMASADGLGFQPLCGNYTTTGAPAQDFGEPLYEGLQNDWVLEEVDLSDYLGEEIFIQFRFVSDGGVTGDGFYFDDLEVVGVEILPDAIDELGSLVLKEHLIYPSPFADELTVDLEISGSLNNVSIQLIDALGRVIMSEGQGRLSEGEHRLTIETGDISSGVYTVQVLSSAGLLLSGKVLK